jgi:SAM-dependent methyltransferase
MSPNNFDPQAYWEERLAKNPNLLGTGHRAFSLEYNRWLYQAQHDCLDLLFGSYEINIQGQSVLDVGSGTGFFVDYYHQKGAQVIGLDIAQSSVNYLHQQFPACEFYVADVSDQPLPVNEPVSLISVISVLYHIVDDLRFQQALHNLIEILAPQGYFLLSDIFTSKSLLVGKHARFRSLSDYESIFQAQNMRVLAISPMYFWLNRTFLPVLGPKIISALHLGRLFYRWDLNLRLKGRDNGNQMKLMLAQKGA